jgi:hypothetical protein
MWLYDNESYITYSITKKLTLTWKGIPRDSTRTLPSTPLYIWCEINPDFANEGEPLIKENNLIIFLEGRLYSTPQKNLGRREGFIIHVPPSLADLSLPNLKPYTTKCFNQIYHVYNDCKQLRILTGP